MTCIRRILTLLDPWVGSKKWIYILAGLSLGWLTATCCIGVGMYMVSCIHYFKKESDMVVRATNICGGPWSETESHAILISGASINVLILIFMICFLVYEKMEQNHREDPPPDYETLLKAETPPPNYDELDEMEPPVYVSEANEALSSLVSISTCSQETIPANSPTYRNEALSTINTSINFSGSPVSSAQIISGNEETKNFSSFSSPSAVYNVIWI